MMKIDEGERVALDDSTSRLLLPRDADIPHNKINADQGVLKQFTYCFEEFPVLGMHAVGKIGRARPNAAAHFLIEKDELPFLGNTLQPEVLASEFLLCLRVKDDRVERRTISFFMSVFYLNKLARGVRAVAAHMRRLSANRRSEFPPDERAAVHEAGELLFDGRERGEPLGAPNRGNELFFMRWGDCGMAPPGAAVGLHDDR